MVDLEARVSGIGYEGKGPIEFVSILRLRNVRVLFDVRLNAISRKKGFSKTALRALLGDVGIEYRHLPQLGNPKDNRDGFWQPGSAAASEAHARFESLLREDSAVAGLDEIWCEAALQPVALMCFEDDESCCHRSLVMKGLLERGRSLVEA